jgi:DNA polymerase-3 subunit alpha (Gram-positive type)
MQIKISEFLKDYNIELPESILCGEIFKLTYSENLERIRFHAHFDSVVPSDDIFGFEKAVETAIKVEQVRLAPRYPSEKFGMDCYSELIKLLKRDIPVVNGFLDDADVCLGNGELRIKIVHGGRDILDRYNFCLNFSRLIYNQFGVRVKVTLEGDNSVSEQQFDEMIERIEADMPDYSSQLIPDKTPEEIRAEEMKSVIPTMTLGVTALDKDFDAESAEIVKGRAIREKPIPICDAVQRLGEKVVVVGDVFASELKEVRKEKTVVTYDITDYSG